MRLIACILGLLKNPPKPRCQTLDVCFRALRDRCESRPLRNPRVAG